MKSLMFIASLLFFATTTIHAQSVSGQFQFSIVATADVPEVVTAAQAANFSDLPVRQWKKHQVSASDQSKTIYMAVFNQNGTNTRARYTASGQGLTAYTNYRPQEMPNTVDQTLSIQYADYQVTGLAKITSLRKDWAAFRVSLRKGGAKTIIWLDLQGNVLRPQQIPTEASETITD